MTNKKGNFPSSVLLTIGCLLAAAAAIAGVDFPGPRIGAAATKQDGDTFTLGNNAISVSFTFRDARLRLREINDVLNGKALDCGKGNLFSISQPDGRVVKAADCKLTAGPKFEALVPDPKSARLAGRLSGSCLSAEFADANGKLRIKWHAVMTDGANYLRLEMAVSATADDCVIHEIAWLDLTVPGARVAGCADGSPVVAGNVFLSWDDPKTLWQFNAGFPNEFTPLAEACRQYQARLGVWLSPFGGYSVPKEQRLEFGQEQGYETNATGFSLAGPKYHAAFKQACVNMIRQHGVNHFKFDGIATGRYASGGAQDVLDTEAMRRLMLELKPFEVRILEAKS
ncbi:MAG: hypothetical protein NTW21_04510 [Verrucomicrobia bacterium]|nr:hypothetical protein [Verrucomicrobiota bacterium]